MRPAAAGPPALRRVSLTALQEGPALCVLGDLDLHDARERDLEGHAGREPAETAAQWALLRDHGGAAMTAWSHAPAGGAVPFAILGCGAPRAGGVADVGLLARDHRAWRTPLARLAVLLREVLPGWAEGRGLQRLEARCWAEHPTASRLLRQIGFEIECALPAYGVGRAWFLQYAMTIGD